MLSFQTLLKGYFSLLTCYLQFSISARVSMTLKRQSVQSLSDHKPFFLRKPRTRNSRTDDLEQNKMVVPSCLEQMGGRVGGVSETGERSENYV